MPLFVQIREGEVERRAFVNLRFGADVASMPMDDALDRRQPDACAFEFTDAMEALERSEQFIDIGHIEPRAIVTDEKAALAVFRLFSKGDRSLFTLRGELPGISDQVAKHDS